MPGAVEVFDDLSTALLTPSLPIPPSPPGIIRVVRTTRTYVSSTVRLYANGLLQKVATVVEIDSDERLVGITEEVPIDELSDSLHISYLTEDTVVVDPNAPIHIAQIGFGDVLRIALRAGRHLDPVASGRGRQHRLLSGATNRVTRNFSRTTVLAYVTSNDRQQGILEVQVSHPSRTSRVNYAGTIYYKDIKHVHVFRTPARPPRVVPVGGGPRAQRHPGVKALGVDSLRPFMNLIPVRF
jgi:hypothetical protein